MYEDKGLRVKYPLFFWDFNDEFSATDFRKVFKYQIP